MKKILSLALICVLAVSLLAGCGESKPVLKVYNWGEYIDEELLSEFEDQYGIEVKYSTFNTNEDLYTKVKAAPDSYDIIVPSDYMVAQMIEEDMLEKAAGYRNEIVKLKVQNYSDELNAFNNMLDESLYDKNWGKFYPDERIPYWINSAGLQSWSPWPLVEEWEQDSSYRKEMMTYGNVTNPNWPEGVWTDEEFDKTRQFLEKVHFYEMHIFRYSRRKGTRADKMENQIPEETKAQRSGILSSLESQMTKEFRTKWTGACVKVLLEERQEINGVSYMVGHTPEYIKCAVETDAPDNTIIDAIIEGELTADVMKARQG